MKKIIVLAAALALTGLSTAACAEGHGFVRGEIGRSNIDISVDELGSDSGKDTTWGIRGGYWFNPNIGLEGFYSQLASETVNDGVDDYHLKLHAVGVGVVAKKNFGGDHQGFFIGGRAGVARGVITAESDGDVEAEASSAKLYYGVGAGYDFSQKFGMSLNYDRLKGGGDGVNVTAKTLTLGFEARF